MQLGSTILKMPTKKAKVHGLFTCVLCGSTMTREPTAGHICISPEGNLSCVNRCPEGKKLLYLEMNYLFTDKQGYLCDTCGDVFKVPVHLDTHLLKVHGIMTDRHKRCQCHICGTTFSLPSHVKKHITHKHTLDGKARTFICDICGKEYDRLDSMMVHKRRHHTEGKRFQCEHCPKKFFGRSHWLNHTRQHFGASNYVCRWCSQQFSSSYSLKVHQRKHTGEKPYQCKLCDACFAQKTSLTVHMKKHQKLDAGVGKNVESSTTRKALPPERRGAENSSRPRAGVSDSAITAQCENSGMSQSIKTDTVQDWAESGKREPPDSFSVTRQENLSNKQSRSDSALMDVLDPATATQDQAARRDRVGQSVGYGMMHGSAQRPEGPMDRAPDPDLVDVLDAPLSRQGRAARQERGDSRELDRLDPAVPYPLSSDRCDPSVMDLLDASSTSSTSAARHHHPPPLPPPLIDFSRELSPGTRGQEFQGGEGFLPSEYKHLDVPGYERPNLSQDAAWSTQGYPQSDPMDGRRLGVGSATRRLHSDPRANPRLEPMDSSQLSVLSAGANHVMFPSFPYPGSSFYY